MGSKSAQNGGSRFSRSAFKDKLQDPPPFRGAKHRGFLSIFPHNHGPAWRCPGLTALELLCSTALASKETWGALGEFLGGDGLGSRNRAGLSRELGDDGNDIEPIVFDYI